MTQKRSMMGPGQSDGATGEASEPEPEVKGGREGESGCYSSGRCPKKEGSAASNGVATTTVSNKE